jgi:hypothetical protein
MLICKKSTSEAATVVSKVDARATPGMPVGLAVVIMNTPRPKRTCSWMRLDQDRNSCRHLPRRCNKFVDI